MATTVQPIITRIDSSANWKTLNPIPRNGEQCIEDLGKGLFKLKIGDGVTPWISLYYWTQSTSVGNNSVLNVTEKYPRGAGYYDLESALARLSPQDVEPGRMMTFQVDDDRWVTYQYNGTTSQSYTDPDLWNKITDTGVFNITTKYPKEDYYTINSAISALHKYDVSLGQIITFEAAEDKWLVFQFQGQKVSQYNDATKWKKVGSGSGAFNITLEYPKEGYYTLSEALQVLKSTDVELGQQITFQIDEENWALYQFQGSVLESYMAPELWRPLYNIPLSQVADEEAIVKFDKNGFVTGYSKIIDCGDFVTTIPDIIPPVDDEPETPVEETESPDELESVGEDDEDTIREE